MREKTKSPCRYKKCKGVIHRGKCPVASSRGSKGGSKVGSSKSRIGSQNGRFVGLRECGCPQRQHKITCSKSQKLTKITKAIINNHDFNYTLASKIHIEDIKYRLPKVNYFKARIICNACEA